MHHVRIKLDDGGQRLEIALQDGAAADVEPARRIRQARGLQGTGGGQGMSLRGTRGLVGSSLTMAMQSASGQ